MKKILKMFTLIVITVILMQNGSYASSPEFKIIEKEGQTKNLENNQGYISKSIVDSNVENGEVTIELKLSNTTEDIKKSGKTEVIFVVDNSASMNTKTEQGITRKQTIINAMRIFVDKIYNQNPNMYMGLVKFSKNANVICNLTNEKQIMLNAVKNFEDMSTESDTNISAGLTTANSNFTTDCKNKIIVLLTDGISTVQDTKKVLLNVEDTGTYIISMVTKIDSSTVKSVFGTVTNPTTGKLYDMQDTNINNILLGNIFNDVIETIQNPITNIKISDYFPDDVINNFDFSYDSNPNFGTVSQTIDENNKNIVWSIDNLKSSENAVFRYKLKLKDINNQDIINKIIPTNQKVELEYLDYNNKKYTVLLENSPKVGLFVQDINIENSDDDKTDSEEVDKNNVDNTTANTILPKTGKSKIIIITICMLLMSLCVLFILNKKYKEI